MMYGRSCGIAGQTSDSDDIHTFRVEELAKEIYELRMSKSKINELQCNKHEMENRSEDKLDIKLTSRTKKFERIIIEHAMNFQAHCDTERIQATLVGSQQSHQSNKSPLGEKSMEMN